MSRVDLTEFVSGFLAEADEHLTSINANLMRVDASLQKNESNPRAVRELFRSLHTIKGLSGMVGVEPVVELSHAMEAVVRTAERAAGRLTKPAFEALLAGARAMAQCIHALAEGNPVKPAPAEVLDALAAAPGPRAGAGDAAELVALDPALAAKLTPSEREQLGAAPASGSRAYRLSFTPSAERAAAGFTISTVRERLSRVAELVKVIPTAEHAGGALCFVLLVTSASDPAELASAAHCSESEVVLLSRAPGLVTPEPPRLDQEVSPASGSVVRVDVKRVDAALEGLAALLVGRYRLVREVDELAAGGLDVRELRGITQELTRKLRDLRGAILSLRMVSASELLARIPILVRGLRTSTRKEVQVELDAGQVELDKAVAERVWPVLVHLVRNAVDHGIEPPEERTRLGKPELGVLSITCRQVSSASVAIAVEDDGGGVDATEAATRAGRPVPTSDAELLELLTLPGLSTRDHRPTSTSGRGMGLDIVKRVVVEELGGELSLRTRSGAGSRFTLTVPLTVAVIEAFRFAVAGQYFLVPAGSVEEFVDIDPSRLVNGPSGAGGLRVAMMERRGSAVPLIDLGSALGLDGAARGPKAIVVRRNEQYFAFAVQRLIDRHEVVVKPLEDPLVTACGVSGTADLGDGQPTLLLDLQALSQRLHAREDAA